MMKNQTIEIGKIEHLLFYKDYLTIQFTNFFNGVDRWTIKKVSSELIRFNQDVYKISFDKVVLSKIEKIAKKANYELVINKNEVFRGYIFNGELVKK